MHDAHLHEFHEAHADVSGARENERRMWAVVALTTVTMVAELAVGFVSGSLALLADGFHMGTHAGALALSGLAYWFARTRAQHQAYSFGTGKVYALAGYTNAVMLGLVAGWMVYESIERLLAPQPIAFSDALPVAVVGLAVNLVSVKLLGHDHGHGHEHAHVHGGAHDHEHRHEHGHDHGHDHHDHDDGHDHHDHDHDLQRATSKKEKRALDQNMRAAYFHVLADALTSIFAILALLAGKYFGWVALDPLMGLVGAAVILRWAYGLVRDTARQLLDVSPSEADQNTIRLRLEEVDDVQVADLHLWEIGPGQRGCIVKVVTARPREPAFYRKVIKDHVEVAHLTVEVQRCPCN